MYVTYKGEQNKIKWETITKRDYWYSSHNLLDLVQLPKIFTKIETLPQDMSCSSKLVTVGLITFTYR